MAASAKSHPTLGKFSCGSCEVETSRHSLRGWWGRGGGGGDGGGCGGVGGGGDGKGRVSVFSFFYPPAGTIPADKSKPISKIFTLCKPHCKQDFCIHKSH